MPVELYYIRNKGFVGNCLLWWRENGHGYTVDIDKAWKVTKEEAERICRTRPKEDFPCSVISVEPHIIRHVSESYLNG